MDDNKKLFTFKWKDFLNTSIGNEVRLCLITMDFANVQTKNSIAHLEKQSRLTNAHDETEQNRLG